MGLYKSGLLNAHSGGFHFHQGTAAQDDTSLTTHCTVGSGVWVHKILTPGPDYKLGDGHADDVDYSGFLAR